MTTITNRKLSLYTLMLLALIGVPRVIAHDLHWVDPGGFVNLLLVFIPPIVWIAVILAKRETKPFQALVLIGVFYGIQLGITHQLFWQAAFETTPQLGGNLSDLAPAASNAIVRSFAFVSSLTTGAVVGLITGAVGVLIHRLLNRISR